MKKIGFCILVLCFAVTAFGIPVTPGSSSIVILLNSVWGGDTSSSVDEMWKNTGLKDHLQNNSLGGASFIYTKTYDVTKLSPIDFVTKMSGVGEKSIQDDALDEWFKNVNDSKSAVGKWKKSKKSGQATLENLKKERMDLIPSKFILVAEGAVGLAVREYIQGSLYRGEFSNVIFFNTPHEGTGFADQALFKFDSTSLEKTQDQSSLAALSTMVLAAYIIGGSGQVKEILMSLAKDAVLGMAYNFGGDAKDAFKKAHYFDNVKVDNSALWYLAQDADVTDNSYDVLREKAKNLNVEEYLGGTQLLNSYSKLNEFSHPNYDVVYSYGFPTIGNGRRTLDDYVNQVKNHVSKEKLKKIVADSLKQALTEKLDDCGINPDTLKLLAKNFAENIINESESYKQFYSDYVKETLDSVLQNYGSEIAKVQGVLKNVNWGDYAKGIAELRSYRFNKDDIPGSVMNALAIIEKFIPEKYKSEIYSSIIENFSPEVVRYGECLLTDKNVVDCAKKGLSVMASNLSNYSLNFFDEGVFDVPLYSAIGEGVAAFKESGAIRTGYSLADIVSKNKSKYSELYDYQKKLSDVGILEIERKVVDVALDVGCEALDKVNPAYGKICKAAEFATNVGLIAAMSSKIRSVVKNVDVLTRTKSIAVEQSVVEFDSVPIAPFGNGNFHTHVLTHIDYMLYSDPLISIRGLHLKGADGTDSVSRMLFLDTCQGGDVYNSETLKKNCADSKGNINSIEPIPMSEMITLETTDVGGSKILPVRMVEADTSGRYASMVKYGALEPFYLTSGEFLKEFQFQIDDLHPDSLWWIKLDFNTRAQIAFERDVSGQWTSYMGTSYRWTPIETIANPVRDDGLFVFRPKEVLNAYGKKTNQTVTLSLLQEDGPNIVNISIMNNAGRLYSTRFSYFFQATDLKLGGGWPSDLATVSRLEKPNVYLNNLAYSKKIVGGTLTISRVNSGIDADSLNFVDSVNVSYALFDSTNKDQVWNIWADLSGLWKRHPIAPGEYMLQWNIKTEMDDGITKGSSFDKLKTTVFVDTTAPSVELHVLKNNLSASLVDGKWAVVQNNDPTYNRTLRAVRGFIVSRSNRSDTTVLFNRVGYAEQYLDVRWDDSVTVGNQGLYDFYVQAFDYAEPDDIVSKLLVRHATMPDSLWSVVTNGAGFRAGINGITLKDSVWIDTEAPKLVNGSVRVNVSSDSLYKVDAFLSQGGRKKWTGNVVNMYDTLHVAFQLREDLLQRDTVGVVYNIVFEDSLRGTSKSYTDYIEMTQNIETINFVEPEANRLLDGVYAVFVEVTDAAGKFRREKIVDKVIVDRTAPFIVNVVGGADCVKDVVSVGDVSVSLSQIDDIPANRSNLECYAYLNAAGTIVDWKKVYDEKMSMVNIQANGSFQFPMESLLNKNIDGYWNFKVGCFDAAGNFGWKNDFFSMGARYPRITYPNDSVNAMYYGKILLKGETPNPELDNRNDNLAEFKLEWREKGDSTWQNKDLMYLVHGILPNSRALAVWDASSNSTGVYEIRLSVRGCSDSLRCSWVSDIAEVPIYQRVDSLYFNQQPTFAYDTLPKMQTPGKYEPIAVALKHANDYTDWVVDVDVYVQSPKDSSVMTIGAHKTFNPAAVSPFYGKPSVDMAGLSVWQDQEDFWHLRWLGNAEGIFLDSSSARKVESIPGYCVNDTSLLCVRMAPIMKLMYVDSMVHFVKDTSAYDSLDASIAFAGFSAGNVAIPAYDRTMLWNLDGDSIHVKFKSTAAFAVDLSSVFKSSGRIFFGQNALSKDSVDGQSRGVGSVYVWPEKYKMNFDWNGLTQTNQYPGGDSVLMTVLAYNKRFPELVVSDTVSWQLNFGSSGLVTAVDVSEPGEMFVGLGDSLQDSASIARTQIGFTFDVVGQTGYVSAYVLDSMEKVVRTLKEHERTIAGLASGMANVISWDGFTDNNHARMAAGRYYILVTVEDDSGTVIDSLKYPFDLKYSEMLKEAPTSGTNYAVLKMDEAREENGELRYEGKLDFMLDADASANVLPLGEEEFRYHWEWADGASGVQPLAVYKKERFSLGIRRHRRSFPVTVAVLMAANGYDVEGVWEDKCGFNWETILSGGWSCIPQFLYCGVRNRAYPYRIAIKRMVMWENEPANIENYYKYGDSLGVSGMFGLTLDPGREIVGYDANGNPTLPIVLDVKVFPADEFANIRDVYLNKNTNVRGYANADAQIESFDWRHFFDKESYAESSLMQYWLDNFGGKVVYWHGSQKGFLFNDGKFYLTNETSIGTKGSCTPSAEKDSTDKNFVCGAKTPDKENDTTAIKEYNPHANMMDVEVVHYEKEDYYATNFKDHETGCGEHDGSAANIKVMLRFRVNPDYWHPLKWGENNLANRYVRFDPTNSTVYGDEGYLYSIENTPSLANNYVNYFNGSTWTRSSEKDSAFITAFEAQALPMQPHPQNPLLFNDEINATSALDTSLRKSSYSLNFFKVPGDDFIARVEYIAPDNSLKSFTYTTSDVGGSSLSSIDGINPLAINFFVAPRRSILDAISTNVQNFTVEYPFKGNADTISIMRMSEDDRKNYKFYKGLASRIHYGVNDWTETEWKAAFVGHSGYVKNPLTEPPLVGFVPIPELKSYTPNGKNMLDSVFVYKVKSSDTLASGEWIVPDDSLQRLNLDVVDIRSGRGPSANWKLVPESASDSGWMVTPLANNKWSIQNPGEVRHASLRYVFNRDSISFGNMNVHVPLANVVQQSVWSRILQDSMKTNFKVENVDVVRRDSVNVVDPYVVASYDANNSRFSVNRTDVDPLERVAEMVTLRGRVPGSGTKWRLKYTKNGLLYHLGSNVQRTFPKSEPYPALDSIDVSRLQGNTSFFLTYGGDGDYTYYRQLDVHIGHLVKPSDSTTVQSKYGNVSVSFAPYAWGENEVDVTARTVSKTDYNFSAFRNLKIAGPVIEVLPSHKFTDSTKYPVVQMRVSCASIAAEHMDIDNLKIYKPDFDLGEIVPLETQIMGRFDDKDNLVTGDSCSYVLLKAVTPSFSTFFAMDSLFADSVVYVDSLAFDTTLFVCDASLPMDDVWAGTVNGWLEYPVACHGKSDYLLQLRSGSDVVAENHGATPQKIIWKLRGTDVHSSLGTFDSKIVYYGSDGSVRPMAGPIVRLDSLAPVIEDGTEVEAQDDEVGVGVLVKGAVSDIGSGISVTTLELYLGGSLVTSRTLLGDSVFAEKLVLDYDALARCVGCAATVKVTAEDFGHNRTQASFKTQKLYPYPTSLVLWYPLREGTGDTAYEMTGTGLDLELSGVPKAWNMGTELQLSDASDRATSSGRLSATEQGTELSVEVKARVGRGDSTARTFISFEGNDWWRIGVGLQNRYFVENASGRTYFDLVRNYNAFVHFVFVFDSLDALLYADGKLLETKRLTAPMRWGTGGRVVIGRSGLNAATSRLRDLRIYSSALTAEQVDVLHNGYTPAVGPDTPVVPDTMEVHAVRAVTLAHDGLTKDLSCDLPGKSYLLQKSSTSQGRMVWNVDVDGGLYSVYLLSRGYATETSRVEIFVNGTSRGIRSLKTTGLWESVMVDSLVSLPVGANEIVVRPVGNLGVAGVALVKSNAAVVASDVPYGESTWTSPAPRVSVLMSYESPNDRAWAKPWFRLRNLTGVRYDNVRLRYYYRGEGADVVAQYFSEWNVPMSVRQDEGSVYYGEVTMPQAIEAFGSVYGGDGPKFGLHRAEPHYPSWYIGDDPSYVPGAEYGFVQGTGVALLDEEGELLNDWACYDVDGPAEAPVRSARVLAYDENYGSPNSTTVAMVVENTGTSAIDGFESRYYFRANPGTRAVDVYTNQFAEESVVDAGGGLYYVSFMYDGTILNPGEKSDFGTGVKFSLHTKDWQGSFDDRLDPSYHNVGVGAFAEADSVVVLDRLGNLLWGGVPRPKFDSRYHETAPSGKSPVRVEGDVVYVTIENAGNYTLETVNAGGLPLETLFSGKWEAGEHAVTIAGKKFATGSYLVLRRGTEILSWQLFR